jgi:N4-gp56 family major capsid protein
MPNLNTTSFADVIQTQYESRLLERATPRLVHGRWCDRPRLSQSGVYEVRKYNSISAMTTPLQEGTTPNEQSAPTVTKITMTPLFYGAWIGHNELMPLEVMDPVISEVSGILGEQAGLSADTLIRDTLIAGATVDYSGSASARSGLKSPAHDLSFADLIKQLAELEMKGAMPADGDSFPVILTPYTWATLMLDPVFVAMFVQEAPDSALRNGYVGKLLRFRFYVSSNAKKYADAGDGGTTDVYTALILAARSHAVLGLAGYPEPNLGTDGGGDFNSNPNAVDIGKSIKPVEIIAKQPGSAGALDPLNQRGTLAWKMNMSPKVVNADWIRVVEHTNLFSNE